jgi:AAA domain
MPRTNKLATEVFTPRGALPNPEMYIPRPDLEADLKQALTINTNVLVRGDSGCGKSWLYKKVLADLNAGYAIVNLAQARSFGSVGEAVIRTIAAGTDIVIGGRSGVQFGVGGFLQGVMGSARETRRVLADPVLDAARILRRRAGKKRLAAIVFDNFEQIMDDAKLIRELSMIMMHIDTPDWAAYNVHNIVVGTPANIREFFAQVGSTPIQNRIREIPEVSRLTYEQAHDLIIKGFVTNLGYPRTETFPIIKEIAWMADRIPQHIHSLCLEVAFESDRCDGKLDSDVIAGAQKRWLQASESSSYVGIARQMQNVTGAAARRRNQVLYALSQMERLDFSAADVERHMRREFPVTTNVQNLGVGTILKFFAESNPPIIAPSAIANGLYHFTNPIYRVCLRVMLVKDEKENVTRLDSPDLSSLVTSSPVAGSEQSNDPVQPA